MIGTKLRQLRNQQNLSLRALAQATGLSHSFICDVEHGRCNPSIETLQILARALGVKPEIFFSKAPKVRLPRPWDEVREAFLPRLVKNDPYTQYQLTTAISTIIRYSLNVKNVSMLTYTQVERAKEIANKILDIINAATTEAVNQ